MEVDSKPQVYEWSSATGFVKSAEGKLYEVAPVEGSDRPRVSMTSPDGYFESYFYDRKAGIVSRNTAGKIRKTSYVLTEGVNFGKKSRIEVVAEDGKSQEWKYLYGGDGSLIRTIVPDGKIYTRLHDGSLNMSRMGDSTQSWNSKGVGEYFQLPIAVGVKDVDIKIDKSGNLVIK
jgi:hypothetical protein